MGFDEDDTYGCGAAVGFDGADGYGCGAAIGFGGTYGCGYGAECGPVGPEDEGAYGCGAAGTGVDGNGATGGCDAAGVDGNSATGGCGAESGDTESRCDLGGGSGCLTSGGVVGDDFLVGSAAGSFGSFDCGNPSNVPCAGPFGWPPSDDDTAASYPSFGVGTLSTFTTFGLEHSHGGCRKL